MNRSQVIVSEDTLLRLRKSSSSGNGSRGLPALIWGPGVSLDEMMPGSFMTVSGQDGSGMSTLLGLMARAASSEGMRVVWLGRHPHHATPIASDLPIWDGSEGYAKLPWFDDPLNEALPWVNEFLAGADPGPGTIILLDKLVIEVPVEALRDVRGSGARIVLGGFRSPDLVPRSSTDVLLPSCHEEPQIDGEPEGRQRLSHGEGIVRMPDGAWARMRFHPG